MQLQCYGAVSAHFTSRQRFIRNSPTSPSPHPPTSFLQRVLWFLIVQISGYIHIFFSDWFFVCFDYPAVNIHVWVLYGHVFILLGCYPENGNVWPYSNFMCNILRQLHTISHTKCPIWQSHQQCTGVLRCFMSLLTLTYFLDDIELWWCEILCHLGLDFLSFCFCLILNNFLHTL